MQLDRQKLAKFLAAHGNNASMPFDIHLFETLPSTNQILWNLLDQGAKPGTVVIASEQTSGRGQWGRQWYSTSGGLYLSVAIAPNLPAHQAYQLTMSSAWGIATALRDRGIPVWLKWPNDLVVDQRKLGGILTETKVQQGRITKAVVGVGINWTNSVPESGINLQSWHNQVETTITSLEILAAVTLIGIAAGTQYLEGIDALLSSYEKLLINMNGSICVDGRCGTIVGVTASGELRVRFCSTIDVNSVADPEICLQPGSISLGYS